MTQEIYFFKLQSAFCYFPTITVSGCCLIILLPYVIFEKYIYILALEMASSGNQHCASCIGTLAFPMTRSLHAGFCFQGRPVGHAPHCRHHATFILEIYCNKLLRSTRSQRPYWCCPLVNEIKNIKYDSQKCHFLRGMRGSLPPTSPYPKWQLDQLSSFCFARRCGFITAFVECHQFSQEIQNAAAAVVMTTCGQCVFYSP